MQTRHAAETAHGGKVHVVVLGEGEYDVPVDGDRPRALGELLSSLGISERDGTLYLNGRPATPADTVGPAGEALWLPRIFGG